jgi:hypothetical protein
MLSGQYSLTPKKLLEKFFQLFLVVLDVENIILTRGPRAWRSADNRWKWQQIGKKPDFEIHTQGFRPKLIWGEKKKVVSHCIMWYRSVRGLLYIGILHCIAHGSYRVISTVHQIVPYWHYPQIVLYVLWLYQDSILVVKVSLLYAEALFPGYKVWLLHVHYTALHTDCNYSRITIAHKNWFK